MCDGAQPGILPSCDAVVCRMVVNRLLRAAAGRRHLTTHDRLPLHLVADDWDVVARDKAGTAGGLAFLTAWTGGCATAATRSSSTPPAMARRR